MEQKDKEFVMWAMTTTPDLLLADKSFGKDKKGNDRLFNNRELADIAFADSMLADGIKNYTNELTPQDMTPDMLCASIRYFASMLSILSTSVSLNSTYIRNNSARFFHKKEDTTPQMCCTLDDVRNILEDKEFDFAGATPFDIIPGQDYVKLN